MSKLPYRHTIGSLLVGALALTFALSPPLHAQDSVEDALTPAISGRALILPLFDSERGRELFVKKGCILCHQVNGIGGKIGPALDATDEDIRPIDFAVRMWRGATTMIALQNEELGYRIELEPDELAAIIGFAYDRAAQATLSLDDLPPGMQKLFIDEPFDGWAVLFGAPSTRTVSR